MFAQELGRVRELVRANADIANHALIASPALDLVGKMHQFRGPREAGEVVERRGNAAIIRYEDQGGSSLAQTVEYRVAVIAVESAFFDIMQYPVLEGRVFADEEENAVLLTPEARDVLFIDDDVLGHRVPGMPKLNKNDGWHNALRVAGLVDVRRIGGAGMLGRMLSDYPLVFVPLSRVPSNSGGKPQSMSLLVQFSGNDGKAMPWLTELVQTLEKSGIDAKVLGLSRQLRDRIVEHLFASALMLAVALMVLCSAGLFALMNVRQLCAARRGEIGIRMAIGEPESRIALRLGVQELRWPLLFVTAVASLAALSGTVMQVSSLAVSAGVAWLTMTASLLIGAFIALRGALTASPARALYEE